MWKLSTNKITIFFFTFREWPIDLFFGGGVRCWGVNTIFNLPLHAWVCNNCFVQNSIQIIYLLFWPKVVIKLSYSRQSVDLFSLKKLTTPPPPGCLMEYSIHACNVREMKGIWEGRELERHGDWAERREFWSTDVQGKKASGNPGQCGNNSYWISITVLPW